MAEAFDRMLSGGPAAAWGGLGRVQQMLLVAAAVAVPLLFFVGSQWMADGQYVPLFASLNAEDAGAIINQLKSSKTPYRVGGNGDQILVPADKAAELRLRMAVQGLPLGGGVGFEVFDKPSFGVGDFTQRLNFQRALQGELARTIGQLREVTRARVHLVLPHPSIFSDRERPASASVFLKLVPGAQLSREQVRGIVHLVASSVEGLSADRVTVVDMDGRVLSAGTDGPGSPVSSRRLEIKTAVEEELEHRLQGLLDAALGASQAVVKVAADVNFDQVERTEETFDPNPVTRQKTRSTETSKGNSSTPVANVVPPPATDNPTLAPPPPASVTENQGNRESETVTYEVSRIVARTLTSPGQIQRLSVSVLVNTATKVTQAADKKEIRQPQPRGQEELDKIKQVVQGAIGFDEERGDQVTVVELPFDTTVLDHERALLDQPGGRGVVSLPGDRGTLMLVVGGIAVTLVSGAALWFAMRARTRKRELADVMQSLEHPTPAPQRAPATAAASARPATPRAPRVPAPLVPEELMELTRERDDIRTKAVTMVNAEPDATAQLLRAWMVKKKPGGTRGSSDGA